MHSRQHTSRRLRHTAIYAAADAYVGVSLAATSYEEPPLTFQY